MRRSRAAASNSIDIEQIAERLAIEAQAKSDGANEEPPSAENEFTGTQKRIVGNFNEMQRRAVAKAALLNDKIRGLRETMEFAQASAALNDIQPRFENSIMKMNARFQSRLDFLGERQLQQQNHYASFREENKLDRVAEYPRFARFYYALILRLIAAGAIAINNYAGTGVSGEMLMPPAWIIGVATSAVLVPFVLAAGVFRSVNHVGELRQLVGWLGGALALAFIGALGLFVTYFASVTSADPEVSLQAALGSLLAAPVAFRGYPATWTASAIVVLLGFLAFVLGYRADDPYPGYGAVQRAYYRARHVRELLNERMRKRVYSLVGDVVAEATRVPRKLRTQVKRYTRMVDKANRNPEILKKHSRELENACNILLDRYRAANRSSRKTDAPETFSERARLTYEIEPLSAELGMNEHRLEDVRYKMAEVDDQVVKVRQRLEDLSWSTINALDDLSEIEVPLASSE
jgi:hypothetical protein